MSFGIVLLTLLFVVLCLAPFSAASSRDDGILILPE